MKKQVKLTQTISFVIPVFNEEKRLNKTFKALNELQLPSGLKLQDIIFVNDGSTDQTVKLVEKFGKNKKFKAQVVLLTYPVNQGKGYAIRQGMKYSTAGYTLFFDADMSTPLSELTKFVPAMRNNQDIVIGTRKNGHSTVTKHQPFVREFLGKGFTKMTQFILGVGVTDFTCGFKAFSRTAKDTIFAQTTINGWGYDAEVLFLASKQNFSMQEVAVAWANDERTKVNLFKAIPQTLKELWLIRTKHSLYAHTLFPSFRPLTNN